MFVKCLQNSVFKSLSYWFPNKPGASVAQVHIRHTSIRHLPVGQIWNFGHLGAFKSKEFDGKANSVKLQENQHSTLWWLHVKYCKHTQRWSGVLWSYFCNFAEKVIILDLNLYDIYLFALCGPVRCISIVMLSSPIFDFPCNLLT